MSQARSELGKRLDSLKRRYRTELLEIIRDHPYDPQSTDPAQVEAMTMLLKSALGAGFTEEKVREVGKMTKDQFDRFVDESLTEVRSTLEAVSKNAFEALRSFVEKIDKDSRAA